MVHDEIGDPFGVLQVFRIARLAVAHRIAVESPRLSAGPRRRVGITLERAPALDRAVVVVAHDMERTGVVAEMVLHRDVGMADRHIAVDGIARVFRGPEEHLEVHHVVDDDRVVPLAEIPRTDQADTGGATRNEALGGLDDHRFRMPVVQRLHLLAEAAEDHETQVVRPLIILYTLQPAGVFLRFGKEFFVAREAVALPKRPGKKSARPVFGIDGPEPGHQRTGKAVRRVEFGGGVQQLAVGHPDGMFQGSDFGVAFRRARTQHKQREETQNGEKISSHERFWFLV